jgi:hypothetical protein
LSKTETQPEHNGSSNMKKNNRGQGKDRERGGRSRSRVGTRQEDQHSKEGGDRGAMRRETTDPTYSFADMIISVLLCLKLIPNQNESEGQTETQKGVSW